NVYIKADIDGMFDNVVSIDAYRRDQDELETIYQGHESRISQNETDIGLKVDDTRYRADKDGFVERFESNESTIDLNARQIDLRVEKTDYDADMGTIDNRISSINT